MSYTDSPGSFGRTSLEITPSDVADLPFVPKALMLTAAGTIAFIPRGNSDDEVVTVTDDLPAGFIVPFLVRRVLATGTTASVVGIGW